MIYLELFLAFFQVGAFSFGGGYAAMPLIQSQVIDHYGWLTLSDFTDLITLSQMTPGPIAINSATFVGNQIAGIPGAFIATLSCILPSCIFVTALSWVYTKYKEVGILKEILKSLRPAVVAMIAGAGLTILIPAVFTNGTVDFRSGNFNFRPVLYFAGSFYLLKKRKTDPVKVMVLCGILEALWQSVRHYIFGLG